METRTYVGKDGICGLKHNTVYQMSIEKCEYGYMVIATRDLTIEDSVDIAVGYSNVKSIDRNWK